MTGDHAVRACGQRLAIAILSGVQPAEIVHVGIHTINGKQAQKVGKEGHVPIPMDLITSAFAEPATIRRAVVNQDEIDRNAGVDRGGECGRLEGQQAVSAGAGRFGEDDHRQLMHEAGQVIALTAQCATTAPLHEDTAGGGADTSQQRVFSGLHRSHEYGWMERGDDEGVDPGDVVEHDHPTTSSPSHVEAIAADAEHLAETPGPARGADGRQM